MHGQSERSLVGSRRGWVAALVLGAVLPLAGCQGVPSASRLLPSLPGSGKSDAAIRKAAEADSFPTAKQVGL